MVHESSLVHARQRSTSLHDDARWRPLRIGGDGVKKRNLGWLGLLGLLGLLAIPLDTLGLLGLFGFFAFFAFFSRTD